MTAPVPFLAAAVRSVGSLAPFFTTVGREFRKFVDSQHGVPTAVFCEKCEIVRPRISSDEAEALIALGEMRKPRQIACRTKGCTGHSAPLSDWWESP
jgi:hypothetical protein